MKDRYIDGYSVRSDGAAKLIIKNENVIALFEMNDNVLTATNKHLDPKVNATIANLTKGWDTKIEKIDHVEFQKLVFDNFRLIV